MIDISADRAGHSLRTLVWQALRGYRTDLLYQFLRDKDVIVRTIAARELQTRGTRKVYEYVSRHASDKSTVMREISAFVLGQLGTPDRPFRERSVPILVKLASSDQSPSVRAAAVSSLGHLRASRSLPVVVDAAQDPSADVRTSAAVALGCLKRTTNSVRTLRKLVRDKDRGVREWAMWSLDLKTRKSKRKNATAKRRRA